VTHLAAIEELSGMESYARALCSSSILTLTLTLDHDYRHDDPMLR